MPYPPGLSRRDLKRGGIIDESISCPECGNTIKNGDADEHEAWCQDKHRDYAELAEIVEVDATPSYDDYKDKR